ncbi:MAG: DUF262 domain-containing HNH endonuclease family protein [Veillonella sp.]|uniref:DUF262 domain-containing protein n=1 Tax=Veillonella sp. TaxID=1926307 RepID=UPI002902048B|nr:DUF262 domain-containing HNH endonuclease family protein [Veillonella sp.]MDU2903143.1 DUF262 domain-containing HNH endonuclease family protein [Veillonella sp.]MDU2965302.1 DUF262 domain-containing HNH endonuclease family protein [Veillonella sp.]
MSDKISAKEYSLSKIFSADFEYHIPKYQRPYSWTEDEAAILFDDLYDFYELDNDDNYFLGSIVLIKSDNKPYSEVIDGQQRLTTLSIFLAVMADAFSTEQYKELCKAYLQEKGNQLEMISAQPRIFLREKDQGFFNKYIQALDLQGLYQLDDETLDSEAKVHIQKNCQVIQERFSEKFTNEDDLIKFCQFVLNRCFLVVVSSPNQSSAFRVFSVLNSRGLDLLPSDIIKSKTIGSLDDSIQDKYTEIWEEQERLVGRDGFNEVFAHTRTIFLKEKQKKNLLEEFSVNILEKINPKDLIDKYIVPYSNAYNALKNEAYVSSRNAESINNLLYWLNKTKNYDWMPVAIKFLAEHENDSDAILAFLIKLERLASYLFVTSKGLNQRINRYKEVLEEMETEGNHYQNIESLELKEIEKEEFIKTLDGEIYTLPSYRRNYIIQRLNSFVSDGAVKFNGKIFTIEHVLPQNPRKDSQWLAVWSEADRKIWVNKIANLVALTRQHNSQAQNYDFEEKKQKYFQSSNCVTSYPITTQVNGIKHWNPKIVETRQNELMKVFIDKWRLKLNGEVIES